ncbi:MAG: phenylalanine--tRNA ligase subunit beta [Thermodesulfobacteriota bacterium]
MKISLNWLKEYVDIRMEIDELVNLLTMSGFEVEGVNLTGQGFDRIVVAEIKSIRKHPNADRLSLVEVRTSHEKFSIISGATNIREGQKVPLALVGAKLPNGMEIKRSKIRGEVSEGMLCSEIELGLGQDASGIMILDVNAPLGVNLGEALGLKDVLLDISITPNRPDCLCVIGIAREIAALTHQKVKYPQSFLDVQGEEIRQRTSITLEDPDLCPRYVARIIEDVKIGPSPFWMRDRLEKVGIRSINNVVDVTNYVMMEYGQPLHAFDFERLEEGRIVVRRAKSGEEFVTLDGVKRTLDEDMLVICDGVKPVAIAGVMGGLNSEIQEETKIVLLESAYFNPMNNRRTSKKLGLETEAAYRFSRGIDYGGCLKVANRAAQLIQELSGGRAVEGALDVYPKPIEPKQIYLNPHKVRQVLGMEIPNERIRIFLENLELQVEPELEDRWRVLPPTYRGDLEREIDLIEEIARMEGYEKIPSTLPKGVPSIREKKKRTFVEKKIFETLILHGYYEVISYSFTTPSALDSMGLSQEDPRRKMVRILNPLSEETSVMRTSLIPGLLETARYNVSRKNLNLKIFELRKVYFPKEGERLPEEVTMLAGLAMGLDRESHWAFPQRMVDFYDMKGCLENLFEALGIKGIRFHPEKEVPYLHPNRASKVLLGKEILGILGEIHPQVLIHYEIPGRAYLFEIPFEPLVAFADESKRFTPLPKYPSIYRDLSIVVDEELDVEMVQEAINSLKEPFIQEVNLFDVYRGIPIPAGKKGLSYRIRYQAIDRTLTDEEVNRSMEKVLSHLREIFKAELRT